MLSLLVKFPVRYARKPQDIAERKQDSSGDVRVLLTVAIVLVGVYNLFGSSIEDVLPHYLMTFVVRELDWSKTSGAHVTSVYWVGLAVGRLSGVGLVRVMSPARIITCCLLALLTSLLAMLLAALFRAHWAVWVSAAAVGLSVAVLFPTGLSYTHQRVSRLTGRLAALIFTTPMCAAMVIPLLLAHLMTRYDDMWYVYLFMVQAGLAVVSFAVLHAVSGKLLKARESAVVVYVEEEEKEQCSESFLQNSSL
nr:hypothetical protein BaRGS_018394 [Batillaria attramentaria]